ncbi:hypothetical protein A3850_011795 [Lewinella sp. 4G2]|nr:hypothetical protein A3850_011795 [Lewinella sp. 4G2]
MGEKVKDNNPTMEDDRLNETIKLHSAGATVRHNSPFEELESYKNEIEIDQSFREEWVIPFYFELHRNDEEWVNRIVELRPKISDEVIHKNLGDFNWRTRSTGAFFAAVKDKKEYIEIIGTHLLKSEVCYAGRTYAKVLAYFNDEKGNEYLERYLEYYLKRKDLYFDQGNIFQAVKYLDKINGTNKLDRFVDDWKEFSKGKFQNEDNDDEMETDDLKKQIDTIEKIINTAAYKTSR